jgi:hypothetical protein
LKVGFGVAETIQASPRDAGFAKRPFTCFFRVAPIYDYKWDSEAVRILICKFRAERGVLRRIFKFASLGLTFQVQSFKIGTAIERSGTVSAIVLLLDLRGFS